VKARAPATGRPSRRRPVAPQHLVRAPLRIRASRGRPEDVEAVAGPRVHDGLTLLPVASRSGRERPLWLRATAIQVGVLLAGRHRRLSRLARDWTRASCRKPTYGTQPTTAASGSSLRAAWASAGPPPNEKPTTATLPVMASGAPCTLAMSSRSRVAPSLERGSRSFPSRSAAQWPRRASRVAASRWLEGPVMPAMTMATGPLPAGGRMAFGTGAHPADARARAGRSAPRRPIPPLRDAPLSRRAHRLRAPGRLPMHAHGPAPGHLPGRDTRALNSASPPAATCRRSTRPSSPGSCRRPDRPRRSPGGSGIRRPPHSR
jgi:hypothetical protein